MGPQPAGSAHRLRPVMRSVGLGRVATARCHHEALAVPDELHAAAALPVGPLAAGAPTRRADDSLADASHPRSFRRCAASAEGLVSFGTRHALACSRVKRPSSSSAISSFGREPSARGLAVQPCHREDGLWQA